MLPELRERAASARSLGVSPLLCMFHRHSFIVALACLIALAACGGKGGNSGSASSPAGLSYQRQDPEAGLLSVDAAAGMLCVPIDALRAKVTGSVETWAITPALPEGLSLNPLNGDITGTPLGERKRTLHTITASNAFGSVSTTLELSVLPAPRYAYLLSPSDSTITVVGYSAGKGTLERRGYAVLPAEFGEPENFEIRSDARYAYSTTRSGYLIRWGLDPLSGWLDLQAQERIETETGAHTLQIAPDGAHLYVGSEAGKSLSAYALDAASGAWSAAGAPLPLALAPRALCFDESGSVLFAALSSGSASQVLSFERTPQGQLVPRSGAATLAGTQPADLVFDASRGQLYLSMRDTSSVLRLAVNPLGSTIALVQGLSVGLRAGDLELGTLAEQLYVADELGSRTHRLAIADSGALSLAGSIEGGEGTRATYVDPMQRHMLMLDTDAHQLRTARAASLSQRLNWNMRGKPTRMAILRGSGPMISETAAVLASAAQSGSIVTYASNSNDGMLNMLQQVQESPGRGSFTLEARQGLLYVIDPNTREIEGLRFDKNNGEMLSSLGRVAVQGRPTYICADASGRFLYGTASDVENEDDGRINTYSIHPQTGVLTLVDSIVTDSNPVYVGMEPSGAFLYVANNGNGLPGTATITIYELDAQSGRPSSSAPSQMAPGAWGLAFPPSGRTVYAALRNSNITVPFRISYTNGGLSLAGPGVRAGFEPVSIAVSPDERNVFVAYMDTTSHGHIAHFQVGEQGLLIAPGDLYQEGYQPSSLDIDPSGRFLYSANYSTGDISIFQIDEQGLLYPRGSVPCAEGASYVKVLRRFQ
jgi:6-phosphogluconolactonase (cycloisomerase 2 family)